MILKSPDETELLPLDATGSAPALPKVPQMPVLPPMPALPPSPAPPGVDNAALKGDGSIDSASTKLVDDQGTPTGTTAAPPPTIPHIDVSKLPGATDTGGGQIPETAAMVSEAPSIDPSKLPGATDAGGGAAPAAAPMVVPSVDVAKLPPLPNVGTIQGIDPTNDLRSATVMPGDDPALEGAMTGEQNATSAIDSFDRQKMIDSLLARNQGPDVPDIAPADDLRAKVIDGADDARTAGYAGQVDSASKALPTDVVGRAGTLTNDYLGKLGNTDVAAGPAISTDGSSRLKNYGDMLDQSVKGLNGVDRVKMAQDLFDQFSQTTDPAYDLAIKKATKARVAAGGARSGMLRTDYGDLALQRSRDLDLQKRSLISDALEKSIQDQYNKAGFLSDTEGKLSSREAGLRDEQRTDRGYATDVATGNVNRRASNLSAATSAGERLAGDEADNAYKKLDTLGSLESSARSANTGRQNALRTERANQFGLSDRKRANFESNRSAATAGADAASNDLTRRLTANRDVFGDVANESRAQRNEVRGERGYQDDLESQAFQRRLAQYNAEHGAANDEFNHGVTLLGAGESGNPSNTLERLAAENPGLDPAMIAQLAASLGNRPSTGSNAPAGIDINSLIRGLGADRAPSNQQVYE